jgi:hypothetical protein
MNRLLVMAGIAVVMLFGPNKLVAQENPPEQGRQGRGGGFRNMDPAQMQQMFMDRFREELNFTNDTDWKAVQPLVQKVLDAQREAMSGRFGGMGRMFRNRGGDQGGPGGGPGGPGGGRGGFFGAQPSHEAEALQKAIDDNAPSAQIKEALAKYQASQKAKQAKLTQAQEDLRKVFSIKQEAQATLLGLLQ